MKPITIKIDAEISLPVSNVTADSRMVGPGSVYVAVQGGTQDGHHFIQSAEKKGAVVIFGEKEPPHELKVPYLRVSNSRKVLAQIAASYYGEPSLSLLMVGVTGTSGKTTTSYLIESILAAAGHKVGVIGTVNVRYGKKVLPSTLTTPGPTEIQHLLSKMKSEGCTAVVMEVSSHSLKQQRVASIAFDGVVFTNLSPEHLDFHLDMEDYYQSKAILFTQAMDYALHQGKRPVVVINKDDEYGRRLTKLLGTGSTQIQPLAFEVDHSAGGLKVSLNGISGSVNGLRIESRLTGDFNCSNIAAAVTLGQGLNLSTSAIIQGISRLEGVPGRLEKVENKKGVHIWVDYAHKPDALEKVLKTLHKVRGEHRLITVFGCGGDRDRKKRSIMGKIAVELSDSVFITSDNPRTEAPMAIIQEILPGTEGHSNFVVEVDRKKAIFQALQSARPGDLVLIAGKGHEDYQIIGTQKVHFDDREVALEALEVVS